MTCSDCAVAFQILKGHSALVGRGLALDSPLTVQDALAGELHFAKSSTEKDFLTQFLECTPDTSGGRLARFVYFVPNLLLSVY